MGILPMRDRNHGQDAHATRAVSHQKENRARLSPGAFWIWIER
jgi:hypothetical protein